MRLIRGASGVPGVRRRSEACPFRCSRTPVSSEGVRVCAAPGGGTPHTPSTRTFVHHQIFEVSGRVLRTPLRVALEITGTGAPAT